MRAVLQPSPLATASCVLLCSLLLAACEKDDACKKNRAKIESCNRVFSRDVCSAPEDRCSTACYAKVRCDEYADLDEGRYPAALSQCVEKCAAKFTCTDGEMIPDWWRCDASEDCADGSDERACSYFECTSGQLLHTRRECDGYPHCSDQSDEASCP